MAGPTLAHAQYWQSKFFALPVLIHGIAEIVLTGLIFIMEIASLAVAASDRPTAAGIWCAIPFMTAGLSTVLLGKYASVTEHRINRCLERKWSRTRVWCTRVLILQLVLLVFTFILIGIAGNFVSTFGYVTTLYGTSSSNSETSSFVTKYHIMQAQLAFGILLMFCGFAYVIFYAVVTYLTIWKVHGNLDLPHLFQE